jgi:DNA mismatch repair protein MutS
MQSGMDALGRELAKDVKEVRAKLGARQLAGRAGDLGPDDAGARRGDDFTPGSDPAPAVDLLWPAGAKVGSATLDRAAIDDLDLERVLRALAVDKGREQLDGLRNILYRPCTDVEVIHHRQAVLADLLHDPGLVAGFEAMIPLLERLHAYNMTGRDMPELFQVAWWLGELETYVECIETLSDVFSEAEREPASAGLLGLRAVVAGVESAHLFQTLARELPALVARIRGVTSITIGINLDQDMQPVAATLLSLNEEPFTESPFLRLLFGGAGDYESVMPLHSVPHAVEGGTAVPSRHRPNPMLIPLFRDLSRVMERVSRPVVEALNQFVHLNRDWLVRLRPAVGFYVGAARLVQRLESAGLPMCLPELAPMEERVTVVGDGYNVALALHLLDAEGPEAGASVVRNGIVLDDAATDDGGRIAVLTGPNRGGKTTFTQSVGLIHVLAQAGLCVPGRWARLSPADNIYTHFPVQEDLVQGTGRFGDEARRMKEIFQKATRCSVVLLNEALSGTYAGESLYLARDVLRIWRMLGARVIFATHLHELAERLDVLNESVPGDSRVVSLVSSCIEPGAAALAGVDAAGRRTYRVVKSPPMGRSYALELARLYGISLDQLQETLRERGLLSPAQDGAAGTET